MLIDVLQVEVSPKERCGRGMCTYVSKTTINQRTSDGSIYINKK
jgi:hypothetical protein